MRKTSVLKEGFDGCLFPVPDRQGKVMIVLTGSDGGLKTAKKLAGYYQKNGMPSLALGYFKTKHTGHELSLIPLETIEKAIGWLKKQGYQKIGIDGISKGTEYAMCAAVEFSEISCVILRTPSYFVSEGLRGGQPSGTSCWTFRGKELPYTRYKSRKNPILRMLRKAKEFSLLEINTGKAVNPASIIPIEKIQAPILILSTKADTVWPSAESGEKLSERLQANHFPYPYRHVCFDYVSHLLVPLIHTSAQIPLKFYFRSERYYPKQCQADREAMVKEINRWTAQVWK